MMPQALPTDQVVMSAEMIALGIAQRILEESGPMTVEQSNPLHGSKEVFAVQFLFGCDGRAAQITLCYTDGTWMLRSVSMIDNDHKFTDFSIHALKQMSLGIPFYEVDENLSRWQRLCSWLRQLLQVG